MLPVIPGARLMRGPLRAKAVSIDGQTLFLADRQGIDRVVDCRIVRLCRDSGLGLASVADRLMLSVGRRFLAGLCGDCGDWQYREHDKK